MTLSAGTRLGPYEILSLLGAGGMGEVYRATDTRLSRDVAVKILPEAFANDSERLARFEREARLLASLNHPGIATLHGLEEAGGSRFLVMELVGGETLGGRIARGPMPIEEAVPLFGQIAEALEAAHEKGIVHRDLKPGNVMVTPEGKVKLLDFGLAKAFEVDSPASDLSHSPTITREATRAGVILGTAAYMSPEQARGKSTDKRTDVWAFGCCLYEALTGAKPFPGETVTDMLAAIVKSEPNWEALPKDAPPRLRELIRRCLQKDPRERLRDIGDARIELERAEEPVEVGPAPGRRGASVWVTAGALAAVAIGLLLGRGLFSKRATVGASSVMRSTIRLPDGQRMPRLWYMPFAISEDGTRLAYAALTKDGVRLYRRALDTFDSTPVPGTEDAMMPFFSPDGEWIGFFAGGKLKKVAWAGGSPLTLATARIPVGGTWGPGGTIVFTPTQDGGLWRVSAEGGAPEELTRPDFRDKGYTHTWPQYVDGGKKILFVQWGGHPDGPSLLDLTSRKWSAVLRTSGVGASFIPTGHLLFGDLRRGPGLFGARFDPAHPERIGPAIPVLEGVRLVYTESGRAWVAFSRTGTLLYARETLAEGALLWQGRQGAAMPIWKRPGPVAAPRLSPDGRSVAFDDNEGDIRILDVERSVDRVLVRRQEANNIYAVWAPDGKRVAFCSNRGGDWDLYEVPVEGGEAKGMLAREFDQCPESWVETPSGPVLAYYEYDPKTGFDIGLLDASGKVIDSIVTEFNDASPALSPGGRFLAFTSNRSGRLQVYLRKLGTTADTQVSLEGGCEPVWSRDGKQLLFRSGDRLFAVSVSESPDLRLTNPALVLEAPFDRSPYSEHAYYDVAPDGRFLVAADASATELQVVTNWFQELNRLVPAR